MYLRKTMSLKAVWFSSLFGLFTTTSFAQGIILNHADLRTDLNWLNQQGVIQISTSTWPMSAEEIQRALSQAKITDSTQQAVIDSVLQIMSQDQQTLKLGLFAESDQKNLPQQFADEQKSQYQARIELNGGGANWDARLRVNAEKDLQIDHDQDINVEGSYLAGKIWNQWIIAGQIPTYWGPGHEGSLIRGDASRPVYGVTVQRALQTPFETKWLSWIGPWQYQAFAGRLDDYKAVPDTNLMGLRLTAQPWPALEVGASRTFQIDGEGQPDSFKAYWNAFVGKDNECNTMGCSGEKNASNQLGGVDARLNLHHLFQVPVSLYGQYVGEDEAGYLPAKKMYLAGADYSAKLGTMPLQLYAEWADTGTNGEVRGISYNHHNYTDGYYQHGFALGHGLGGDAQMVSLGGDLRINPLNRVTGRILNAKVNQSLNATKNNHAFKYDDEIQALDLTWSHYIRPDIPLKINGWVSDSNRDGKDGGASIGIELPLDSSIFK